MHWFLRRGLPSRPRCVTRTSDRAVFGRVIALDMPFRRLDHEVAIEHRTGGVNARRDRLEHDRPHRDGRNEVAVAHIEVENPHARLEQLVDLLTEAREVGRVQRGLDLVVPCPFRPGHEGDLRRVWRNLARRHRRGFVKPSLVGR